MTIADVIAYIKHQLRTGSTEIMRATIIPTLADHYVRPRASAFERVRPVVAFDLVVQTSDLAQAAAARLRGEPFDEVEVHGQLVRAHLEEPLVT